MQARRSGEPVQPTGALQLPIVPVGAIRRRSASALRLVAFAAAAFDNQHSHREVVVHGFLLFKMPILKPDMEQSANCHNWPDAGQKKTPPLPTAGEASDSEGVLLTQNPLTIAEERARRSTRG